MQEKLDSGALDLVLIVDPKATQNIEEKYLKKIALSFTKQ